MGHDYIDLGTSHLRLNDSDIWTLRHFFCDTLTRSTPVQLGTDARTMEDLRRFIASWEWLGPGIVNGCDLNIFATTPERFSLIQRMFSATRDRLREFGESIPLPYLDEHINSSFAYYLDAQPVARFTDILDSLLDLPAE